MRHGESQNNVLANIDRQMWREHKVVEPELSQQGEADCRAIGQRFSELGIRFDLMLTSAHKRAIQSLKLVRETYANSNEIPCQLMTLIHEEHGPNFKGQVFPGLSRSQVVDLFPELIIPEDEAEQLTEEGWCHLQAKEIREEVIQRAKLCLQKFKDMAKQSMRGKTILAVSHGMFIHNLACVLMQATNDTQMVEAYTHNPQNNSLMIIDFDVEERPHFKGTGMVTAVLPRLVALNFQIIEPSFNCAIDFQQQSAR